MAKRVAEHIFTGTTTPYTAYDSTKTNLGVLIQQRTGATPLDKFAGPMPIGMGRLMEASVPTACAYPHVIPYNSDNHWVFFAENAAASPTRRIVLYNYQLSTSTFTWSGYITLTFPTATNHTVRGFRMSRELYTTGNASVSGTAVTGTGGTAWNTSNLTIGSRIGFGSSDPTLITTWYEISAIGSDTSITLTASAGTISSGAYVISDLRAIVSTTNATATNGGLFVAKGLREELFLPTGTTIAAATSTDNQRAVYWLADASTVTNITAGGVAIDSKDSWTQHYVYVLDGTTSMKCFKYNIRGTLSGLASGKSTSALTYVTGAQTVTGTSSQANNGRIGTLSHGPGSGVKCLYFVTTTRVYRCVLSLILNASITWQSDAMVEVPPGSSTTYGLTGALNSVEIADAIDRLIVMSSGSTGFRSYITKYNTNSDQFDHIFLVDDKQIDQSTTDAGAVAHPSIQATVFSVWSEGGVAYLCRNGTTAILNQVYALPLGAHWTYAASSPYQRLMTPALATPDVSTYERVYVNNLQQVGTLTLGLPPEPFRAYYRTSGISDDSGTWTLLDSTGIITDPTPASSIQIMIEFKAIGSFCIPGRIFSACVVYEDTTTDSHYQPSVGFSSIASKQFAWRFSTAFGSTVPTMYIHLYNAVTGGSLGDDDSVTKTGTWEKSTDDGATWGLYNSTDKANETTYIRYTLASLPDNVKVRAVLAQL